MMRFLFIIPGIPTIFKLLYQVENPKLEREVFGVKFKNPVGLAAGFDKDARLINELSNLGFGFIEIGTLTPKGQSGNDKPRLFRLTDDAAIINRMGFNNGGVEVALEKLKKRSSNIIVGGSSLNIE
jgi:dihydroorotate dehydrogenase